MSRGKGRRRLKKGVFILPSIFTSLNLFCAFYSITASLQGHFLKASWAIIIAAAFDAVDGRIARLTHSVSKFGEEYDSLVDMVSFGIAPALMIYLSSLQLFGRWGWLAAAGLSTLWYLPGRLGSLSTPDLITGLALAMVQGLLLSFMMKKTQHAAAPALVRAVSGWLAMVA